MNVQDRLEVKTEPSTYNPSGSLAKELEDELMKFTKKDEDLVDITECTKSLGNEVFTSESRDTTECSSSFEDTSSGFNNVNDSEALSVFCDDATSSLDFAGFSEKLRMRKKKPSPHWRSFIQPLMWRCKWVELQMRRLQTETLKHEQEIEAYNKQKQIQFDNSTLQDGVKSIPFSKDDARSDILRRKKRKKTEATTDVATYMSRHNLFSYYENKRSSSEAAFVSNEIKNPVNQKVNIDDEFLAKEEMLTTEPGGRDGDCSFENLLCKIYLLQSQVGKLKDRIDKVTNENVGTLSCSEDYTFTMPCNPSTSSNGERMPVGTYIASQLLSEYNMGDALLPENAVMNHGDAPDANGRVEDGDLIDNQRVKDEMNSLVEVKMSQVPKEEVRNSEEETSHSIHSHLEIKEETGDGPATTSEVVTQSSQKVRSLTKTSVPKSKKKRARRRGGGRWSRRSTG